MRANTPARALAQNVLRGGPDDCWLWQGCFSPRGYGIVGIKSRQYRAHRVAYEVAKGPIPDGLIVRHTCDNPPCCNPAHLLVGTHADNTNDKVQRGRQLVGERIHHARLTRADVPVMRARHAAGESFSAIGRDYGVHYTTVRDAVRGRTWKHIKESA